MDVDRIEIHRLGRVEWLARDGRHLFVVGAEAIDAAQGALALHRGRQEIEPERRRSDLDHIAVREHERVVFEVAVDHRAVARAAIDDHPRAVVVTQIEVLARHRDVGEHEVVIEPAPDRVRLAREEILRDAGVVASGDHEPGGCTRGRPDRRDQVLILIIDRVVVATVGAGDVRDQTVATELRVALFDGRTRFVGPLRVGFDRGFFVLVRKRFRLRHNVWRNTLRPAM